MKLPMAFVLLSAAARATVVSAFSVRTAALPRAASAAACSPNVCLLAHSRSARAPTHLFSTAASSAAETDDGTDSKAVPITLLAGFLGSGKTTALKNLLENREGIRVGVVVNDVAAVNIDAKLIANPGNDGEAPPPTSSSGEASGAAIDTDYGGTVELQNGCACCSLADELLTSVETLMAGRTFDAVVVELSGVADPVAVKQNWDVARMVRGVRCL